jgi:hypothetical protein
MLECPNLVYYMWIYQCPTSINFLWPDPSQILGGCWKQHVSAHWCWRITSLKKSIYDPMLLLLNLLLLRLNARWLIIISKMLYYITICIIIVIKTIPCRTFWSESRDGAIMLLIHQKTYFWMILFLMIHGWRNKRTILLYWMGRNETVWWMVWWTWRTYLMLLVDMILSLFNKGDTNLMKFFFRKTTKYYR